MLALLLALVALLAACAAAQTAVYTSSSGDVVVAPVGFALFPGNLTIRGAGE